MVPIEEEDDLWVVDVRPKSQAYASCWEDLAGLLLVGGLIYHVRVSDIDTHVPCNRTEIHLSPTAEQQLPSP